MPVNAYWAYGLSIQAELLCPELPPHPQPTSNPDVTIHLLPSTSDPQEKLANGHYEVQQGVFRLVVPGVAEYLVEHGRRISIKPLPDASPDKVRLFLLSSSMGALLYQRGLFPLHGSAVETRWGAMIFVGAKGAGKSTLAAQFHSHGYRLLSDDVCAVAADQTGLQILPALAQFRLCADAFERLGAPPAGRLNVDKFVVPMGEGYCPHPTPLRAIHILTDCDGETPFTGASPRFDVLQGFSRVHRLLENLYRPEYLKGQGTQSDLMGLAGRIAQKATLAVVTRRRDADDLGGLVRFLESTWAEQFAEHTVHEKRN